MEAVYTLVEMSEKDRNPVIDIFNYFIEHTFAAYPDKNVGYQFFDRFLEISKGYPAITVRTSEGGTVGFAFLYAYHPMSAFDRTAQATYFILPEHTRRGLGDKILTYLTEQAKKRNIDSLLVHISSLNEISINFHKKSGFHQCGVFKGIGRKFGKDFDIIWMQKNI